VNSDEQKQKYSRLTVSIVHSADLTTYRANRWEPVSGQCDKRMLLAALCTVQLGYKTLRRDLEDDAEAVGAALRRRAVKISVFVKHQISNRESAVSAGKIVQ
jgi:hypothetical protein